MLPQAAGGARHGDPHAVAGRGAERVGVHLCRQLDHARQRLAERERHGRAGVVEPLNGEIVAAGIRPVEAIREQNTILPADRHGIDILSVYGAALLIEQVTVRVIEPDFLPQTAGNAAHAEQNAVAGIGRKGKGVHFRRLIDAAGYGGSKRQRRSGSGIVEALDVEAVGAGVGAIEAVGQQHVVGTAGRHGVDILGMYGTALFIEQVATGIIEPDLLPEVAGNAAHAEQNAVAGVRVKRVGGHLRGLIDGAGHGLPERQRRGVCRIVQALHVDAVGSGVGAVEAVGNEQRVVRRLRQRGHELRMHGAGDFVEQIAVGIEEPDLLPEIARDAALADQDSVAGHGREGVGACFRGLIDCAGQRLAKRQVGGPGRIAEALQMQAVAAGVGAVEAVADDERVGSGRTGRDVGFARSAAAAGGGDHSRHKRRVADGQALREFGVHSALCVAQQPAVGVEQPDALPQVAGHAAHGDQDRVTGCGREGVGVGGAGGVDRARDGFAELDRCCLGHGRWRRAAH